MVGSRRRESRRIDEGTAGGEAPREAGCLESGSGWLGRTLSQVFCMCIDILECWETGSITVSIPSPCPKQPIPSAHHSTWRDLYLA